MQNEKCAMVVADHLPTGVIANTTSVLALSIGRKKPDIIGHPLTDHQGKCREGITRLAIPVLKASQDQLKELRSRLLPYEPDLVVVDLVSATRNTRNYEEYADYVLKTPENLLEYQGIALLGTTKLVNRFTGNLGLLR